ncbi:MAG TPA: hypothetical protein VFI47_11455 [Acidimicrobiales bacterium]|nr:hypothetical protein [Acidimicrobiales bacterium]
MAETPDVPTPDRPDEPDTAETPEPRPRRRAAWLGTWPVLVALAVALFAAGGLVGALVADDDDGGRGPHLARMEQACEQWTGMGHGPGRPGDGWCAAMGEWMNDRMGDDHPGPMMGSVMRHDPAAMAAICPARSGIGSGDGG